MAAKRLVNARKRYCSALNIAVHFSISTDNRVRATGAKRKTGPAQGTAAAPREGVRKRTFPGLPRLYASEGVPQPKAPKPAEQRALAQMKVARFRRGGAEGQRRQTGVPTRRTQRSANRVPREGGFSKWQLIRVCRSVALLRGR